MTFSLPKGPSRSDAAPAQPPVASTAPLNGEATQTATPRGDASAAVSMPAISAALAASDFQQRLFGIVDAEMSKLTSAHALDEWHGDYLDPRIAEEVRAEHHRIEAAATSRRAALKAQALTLKARLEGLKAEQAAADADIRTAQAELDRRVADTAPLMGIQVAEGSAASAAALLRVLESTSAQEPVDRRRGAHSESEQLAALATQEQLLAERTRRVDAQHRAVDRATGARRAAEERFRRAGGNPPATDPGAPSLPGPVGPEAGSEAAADRTIAEPATALPAASEGGMSSKAVA